MGLDTWCCFVLHLSFDCVGHLVLFYFVLKQSNTKCPTLLFCFTVKLRCKTKQKHQVFVFFTSEFDYSFEADCGLDTWCCFVLHLSLTVKQNNTKCCFVLHLSVTTVKLSLTVKQSTLGVVKFVHLNSLNCRVQM